MVASNIIDKVLFTWDLGFDLLQKEALISTTVMVACRRKSRGCCTNLECIGRKIWPSKKSGKKVEQGSDFCLW